MSKRPKTDVIPAGITAPTDNNSFRKAIEAIAIKPHAGKLTLLTRKINNVLLAEAQEQGAQLGGYRIPLSRLCARADYDSTNTTLVKDQLRRMASTTVEWNTGVKGSRRWGVTNLINVELVEEGNRCYIEWDYPPKLKEKLLAPDVYARLSLQMQSTFRSAAALALYEICVRYVDSPGQLTMRMPWEEWRPVLTGVPDREESTYQQYKYFKRDVVKPSVAEVNSLTHIQVELIEHKVGRTVAELQFGVRPKKQAALELDDPNLFDLSILERIKALGFPQEQAERLYADTDEGKLKMTLDFVEGRLKAGKPAISKPAAYFRDALKRGYGVNGGTPPKLPDASKPQAGRAPKAAAKRTAAQATEALLTAWREIKRAEVQAAFYAKSPAGQQAELARFDPAAVAPGLPLKKWTSEGLKNPLWAAEFWKWQMEEAGLVEPSKAELLQFGLEQNLLALQ